MRAHPPRGARLDRPRRLPDRLAQRARPAPNHRRRARTPPAATTRARARRRLLPRRRRRRSARPQPRVHLRPPIRRLPTYRSTPGPLPGRYRRPHQPPQTTLRPQTIPPQRPPRRQNLDRLGDPHLQPGHPRHPDRMTPSPCPKPPIRTHPNPKRPRHPPPGAAVLIPDRLSGASSYAVRASWMLAATAPACSATSAAIRSCGVHRPRARPSRITPAGAPSAQTGTAATVGGPPWEYTHRSASAAEATWPWGWSAALPV